MQSRRAMKMRVGPALDQAGEPVEARVRVGVAERLDERRGEVVMLLAPLVVGEPGAAEGLDERLAVDVPTPVRVRLRRQDRRFQRRQGDAGIARRRRSPGGRGPRRRRSGRSAARPRSGSARARRRIAPRSASVRGCRVRTRARDSKAALTSKEGFSVVAPIRVTVPSSTAGRRASCWALLKRWISSMNRTVRRPRRRRLAGLGDRLAQLLDPRQDGREGDESRPGPPGEQAGERRLARARRPPEDQ